MVNRRVQRLALARAGAKVDNKRLIQGAGGPEDSLEDPSLRMDEDASDNGVRHTVYVCVYVCMRACEHHTPRCPPRRVAARRVGLGHDPGLGGHWPAARGQRGDE